MKAAIALSVSWIGAILSFALQHLSAIIGAAAGIAAIIASVYTILVRRKQYRFLLQQLQQPVKIIHTTPPLDA